MAYITDKDTKKYYSISEVSEIVGVSESLLRYWEKMFPTIKPKKSGRNIRQYTKEDIEEIKMVHNLVKVRGMKLATARETINKNRSGVSSVTEAMAKLEEIRSELMQIKKELESI
ncbi:MAG: MerR family transcriptional regulator [Bacteroidaceae bacterium]|nr:MerR family transcriptional regulator [Bacteroidaceae bacterium]